MPSHALPLLKGRVTVVKGMPSSPPDRNDVQEKFALLRRHCPAGAMPEIFERLQGMEAGAQLRLARRLMRAGSAAD
jgi:hypothetical protein